MIHFIKIDENSRVPKYQQIVDSVVHNISVGNLKMNQKILSINKFSEAFYLSRDTVEHAYSILKKKKIISSVKGKGYFINNDQLTSKVKIFFLVNKLSAYKLRVYNSFVETIGPQATVDLQIYHCDEQLFLSLLEKNKLAYNFIAIMPHFKGEQLKHLSFTPLVRQALQELPANKLIFLDNVEGSQSFESSKVFQDFENDIYQALNDGLEKIKSYKKVFLIYPKKSVYPYPKRIVHGFSRFCSENSVAFQILDRFVEDMILKKGDLFVVIDESDLVDLVKHARLKKMTLGKDIGIISYNDTPLKELLGISVVSTDFKFMGQEAAKLILQQKTDYIKAPFYFIDRQSI